MPLRGGKCGKSVRLHAGGGTDVISRPAFAALLDEARPGDTLVVWKLDRAGRSTRSLLVLLDDLETRGVAFRSLTEAIDTGSPSGRLLYSVLGAVASYESDLISSRTRAGLDAARARGRVGGRPPALSNAQVEVAQSMSSEGMPVTIIARVLGVGRATIYRATGIKKTPDEARALSGVK